jgi:hypothetical protein
VKKDKILVGWFKKGLGPPVILGNRLRRLKPVLREGNE